MDFITCGWLLALGFGFGGMVGHCRWHRPGTTPAPWDFLEPALTTASAVVMGGAVGVALGGTVGLVLAASCAGVNGLLAGVYGIHDWRRPRGWFAFAADCTWGLLGTTLGNLLHLLDHTWPGAGYRADLSARQERHVYERGATLKPFFSLTLGNAISNAALGEPTVDLNFLRRHEELHVWQHRWFGPVYPLTYIVWGVLGAVWGILVWCRNRDQSLFSLVETAAYYNNPFEYWAYNNDRNWPPYGIHPKLAWRGRAANEAQV